MELFEGGGGQAPPLETLRAIAVVGGGAAEASALLWVCRSFLRSRNLSLTVCAHAYPSRAAGTEAAPWGAPRADLSPPPPLDTCPPRHVSAPPARLPAPRGPLVLAGRA